MKSVKIPLIALLFCYSLTICATEYHVAKHGNDQNNGSHKEPWQHIATAARIAQPGDTVTVYAGLYRENVNPLNGGVNDLSRIVYRAAPGEEVVIKGSEVIKGWKQTGGTVWQVVIPNTFFGNYNPYADLIVGDWFANKKVDHHTGEVYLNERSLFEKSQLDDVRASRPYPDARDQEASTYTWYSEVGEDSTTIWANFQEFDPNRELVEINVRKSCFYPDKPGVNYITVRGFIMSQAATQWAAPTAEQVGLIGTHWSKGWIIEDNIISNSKCVGITLGKDRSTGHNVWIHNPGKDGATHYNEVIFKALEIGWSKEKIGSHVVRNNEIFACEQAGIVGSLGAIYSEIYNNHLHDIWTKRIFKGAEIAGIKIHAAIDGLIKNNRVHNTGRGIWIDWMAQGTRITQNLLYDNTTDDLFAEVNHGPYLVDNNLFLSPLAIKDWSEGGAFVHNLIAGKIEVKQVKGRFTPYHFAHSTKVAGLRNIYSGDNRFFNNIFIKTGDEPVALKDGVQFYGLHGYTIAQLDNLSSGNVYYYGAKPGETESNFVLSQGNPSLAIEEEADDVYLRITLDDSADEVNTMTVTTSTLGATYISEAVYEQPDGSSYLLDTDYLGNRRDQENPTPGPFENIDQKRYKVW